MSAALEKSLDDIISSSRNAKKAASKRKPVGRASSKSKTSVTVAGKGTGKAQKKNTLAGTNGKVAKVSVPKAALSPSIDVSQATKVVAHGLPTDLKQDVVKEFFQSQVGGVKAVSLSYNEKGQFKGTATIIFKSSKNAALAIEKYHNAPVDNGSNKLRLELIVGPAPQTLASRIAANTASTVNPAQKKEKLKKALLEKRKQTQQKKKKDAAKHKAAQKPKPKASKPDKKTAEQLDQEMTDYFNN